MLIAPLINGPSTWSIYMVPTKLSIYFLETIKTSFCVRSECFSLHPVRRHRRRGTRWDVGQHGAAPLWRRRHLRSGADVVLARLPLQRDALGAIGRYERSISGIATSDRTLLGALLALLY